MVTRKDAILEASPDANKGPVAATTDNVTATVITRTNCLAAREVSQLSTLTHIVSAWHNISVRPCVQVTLLVGAAPQKDAANKNAKAFPTTIQN